MSQIHYYHWSQWHAHTVGDINCHWLPKYGNSSNSQQMNIEVITWLIIIVSHRITHKYSCVGYPFLSWKSFGITAKHSRNLVILQITFLNHHLSVPMYFCNNKNMTHLFCVCLWTIVAVTSISYPIPLCILSFSLQILALFLPSQVF